tara:strand:+ start:761 stop:964 length:204 start_codon:yes stop_codon:yes gene_type:complete
MYEFACLMFFLGGIFVGFVLHILDFHPVVYYGGPLDPRNDPSYFEKQMEEQLSQQDLFSMSMYGSME